MMQQPTAGLVMVKGKGKGKRAAPTLQTAQ
jgi:hypothetical protein